MCPRNSIVSEIIGKSSRSGWSRQLLEKVGSQSTLPWFNLLADMEKPSARGPSPSRKAHRALGQILNRKSKHAPRLPAKKVATTVDRAASR